jgi:deuterolysin
MGGEFVISTEGFIPILEIHDRRFDHAAPVFYRTNHLVASVDGWSAANVRNSFVKRHVLVAASCTSTQLSDMTLALAGCASMARAASQVATSGPGKRLIEFFKSDSPATRSRVADVFNRAEAECANGTAVRQYCSDRRGKCTDDELDNTVAYAIIDKDYIGTCPKFWTLPNVDPRCYAPDKAHVALHEATHLRQVGSMTDLFFDKIQFKVRGCYGHQCVTEELSEAENLRNADTYALFAHGEFPAPREVAAVTDFGMFSCELLWRLNLTTQCEVGISGWCKGNQILFSLRASWKLLCRTLHH